MTIPKWLVEDLEHLLAHAEALSDTRPNLDPARVAQHKRGWPNSDPQDDTGYSRGKKLAGCSIDRQHREAVNLYVNSWIVPRIKTMLEKTTTRKPQ
jgi:hypothetical protein